MEVFLSFLTIPVEIIRDHLGSSTGWTQRKNGEHRLIIGGGFYKGVEWLDTLQYGEKLSNPWNDYVNPFFLFDILTKEGKRFFLDYYEEDIEKIIINLEKKKERLEKEHHETELLHKQIWQELKRLSTEADN